MLICFVNIITLNLPVQGGQFPPESGGQFRAEQVVSFRRNQVVNISEFSR